MSDISLPYRPRPDEDPRAASVVQANLEFLVSLFQKGVSQGDIMQWDPTLGRYVAGSAVDATPIGAGKLWFTDTAPLKWILLDGTDKNRVTYEGLFALWGTTFGVGDGVTTFGIPDMRGRIAVGKGTHADVNALAKTDGAALADRRPKHKHTVNDPSHHHGLSNVASTNSNVGTPGGGIIVPSAGTSNTQDALTGVTVGPQTNVPTDGPAFFVVNFIVFTGV